ncbi:hypothetical protein BCR33DRAFT_717427 [Rhizoclosmatium globosum]|uniref:FZ domain-containing protein n=1 Tax=Rhizoclosmatium globosum TaxID=329046 RepID=A0A1Y2CAA0_9FUNG|nr:hypothetical protein BCR33DRAFT_717427 [Rhizoclosmatium globosum]|eukprot:ORY43784.1 hypothetical protein BCR33DRAFT_717427 [Rhizoclosmatium globosum]
MDLLLMLNSSTPAYRPCVSAFLKFACYSSYPSCENGAVKDVPCASICQDVVTQCTTLFTSFGKASIIPNCKGNVQGLQVPYSTSKTCLGYVDSQNTTIVQPPPPPPTPVTCQSILIKDPRFNASDLTGYVPIHGQTCTGGCCLPCPRIYQFYDNRAINGLNIAYQTLAVLSAFGAGFTFLSYVLFAKRRQHPGCMMMYFSLGGFICHSFQAISIGSNGYRTGCVDSITEADQSNSALCGIQGFVLMASALYLLFWNTAFMFNLHLQLIWRKDIFSGNYFFVHTLSILFALVPTISTAATNGFATNGFTCLTDPHHAIGYLIIPMGVVGLPGVAITVYTVVALIVKLLSAPGQHDTGSTMSTANAPSGKSNFGKSGVGSAPGKSQPPVPESTEPYQSGKSRTPSETAAVKMKARMKKHQQKVIDLLTKSWRSLVLCIAVVIIFLPFWTENMITAFYFQDLEQTTPWVLQWFSCIANGGTQQECYKNAEGHIPSFGDSIISLAHVTIGSFIFLVFGVSMIDDWKELLGLKK